jgi:biopolymer transport protein ExbB
MPHPAGVRPVHSGFSKDRSFVPRILLLALLCMPSLSYAWWGDDWNFRKEISFDLSKTGANISGSVQDVPVLIRLHAGNFGYFNDVKKDGSDFRVVDGDDKTPLKFHIERFDPVNQLAFLWVRVPQVAGGSNNQKIFLYYGNPKAASASDAGGTYDKNQALVLHFSDSPPLDSSSYANQPVAPTAESNPASLIAGGVKLNGSESLNVPASPSLHLAPAAGATVSAWVRFEAPQRDAYVAALQDQGAEFVLGVRGARAYARISGSAGTGEAAATTDVTASEWHHLAASYASGKLNLYVDGALAATTPVQAADTGGQLTVGNSRGGDRGFAGEMDEVQFSNTARNADWIAAAARSQGMEAPLVAYGGDAQREAQKVSYFRVTLQNVTADGWVVIGILLVMLLVALLVMVSKAIYLARVSAGNAKFLSEYAKLSSAIRSGEDPEAAAANNGAHALAATFMPIMRDAASRFRQSTICRLYERGLEEVDSRVGAKSVGARAVTSLSSQAIDAIRATMDATQVRLTQSLAANMVLLTIAIAGGPFLGLLGTVVGVMITFAAIAASGDVNVNSIAPGIAAALVATVAGLGVAIPSLFGYNWLNTRIKEINADMRVFTDEFITRVAENSAG